MVRIRLGLHRGEKFMEPDSPLVHALHSLFQPLQRRCRKCQFTWLCNTLEEAEFIPAAACSDNEGLPGRKEGQDRKSNPQRRGKKVEVKMVMEGSLLMLYVTTARVSGENSTWEHSWCPAKAYPIL